MPAIQIANGTLFDPWHPTVPDPVWNKVQNWDWLGHHLANECRYAGGCKWFYSVAQHSVLVARRVMETDWAYEKPPHNVVLWDMRKLGLASLLHDATEATLKDIPGPYKKGNMAFRGYKQLEGNLAEWIYEQFGLGKEYLDAPPIKTIDKELLDAERFVLFPDSGYVYTGGIRVEPWDREYARDEFNRTLRSLTNA